VTSALRRGGVALADARSDAATGRSYQAPRTWPRLPDTWPLAALFVLFPLWWVLGLSAVIWTIVAAPMVVALIWRHRTKAPAPTLLWIVFTVWVLMCGLQLESGTKLLTFSYRWTLYACAGIIFLYVYNLPRAQRIDIKVLRILVIFWMIVVAGGYAGIIFGAHTFQSAIEYVLPHRLQGQAFVQELVQPVFANVVSFLGFPVPRPSAPFPYTNNWGGNIAVLTPVALAAMSVMKAGLRRRVIIIFLIASLVPMVVSLNRGMFLSLGVGVLYVAMRLAGRGRVGALLSLLGVLILMIAVVALTPLGHLVISNLSSSHGHSNTTRISVSQQAIQGANQSPIFGWGEPQAVTGQGGTPPIGTQGQLWMLLYSDGYIATALFLGFYLFVLWQTRKARGTAGLWLHAVPLIALSQITVYGWLPAELQVVMVIAALAYRWTWPPHQHAHAAESGLPRITASALERQLSRRRELASKGARGAATLRAALVSPGAADTEVGESDTAERAAWPRRRQPEHREPSERNVVVPAAGGRPEGWPASTDIASDPAVAVPAGESASQASGMSAASRIVARGSVINLAAMVTGAAMSFGLVVLVSRWLQPRDAGGFFELIALFTILSNTFELGADTGLTRWISRARAIGGLADTERIVTIAAVPVIVTGTAAAVILWVYAADVAGFFLHGIPVAAGATDIRYIAPLVPLGSLSACLVDGARGFGRMWPYLAIEGLGKPAVRLAAVVAVLAAGFSLRAAIIVWGLPVIAGLLVGGLAFFRIMRKEVPVGRRRAARRLAIGPGSPPREQPRPIATPKPKEKVRFPVTSELDATVELPVIFEPVTPPRAADRFRSGDADAVGRHRAGNLLGARSRQLAAEFWGFTGPRAFQATFQVTVLWFDILLVGALTSSYQAGIYSAVSKLAILGTFALEGNRLAIGPQLSAMLARKEHDQAAELYQTATRSLILATWPLYLTLAIFAPVILGIFGPKYVPGGAALETLALAMLVNLGTGNVTVVLLMGGKSSWSAINAGAALAVNVGLNLLLVPRMGILGAAIAWAASIIVDNVAAMIEIRFVMGLAPFGPGYWLASGITLASFAGTGVAARLILGQTVPALLVAAACGLAFYAVLLFAARRRLQLAGVIAAFRPNRSIGPTTGRPQAA